MKKQIGECYPLKMLNVLMSGQEYSTRELCELVGCERKTIYKSADILEISGFSLIIESDGSGRGKNQNKYRLNKVFGF